MNLVASQQRVVAVLGSLAQSKDPWTGAPIDLVEASSDNDTWVTETYSHLTGVDWNGDPWCAMTVSLVGYYAHDLAIADFGVNAWGLTDHLKAAGHGLTGPEVGAVVSYAGGDGHTGTIFRQVGGTTYDVGEGNWGDRFSVVRRDLADVPGGIHGYARFPGVDAEIKAIAHGGPPPPAPPGPFGGHPVVQWIGHAQTWYVTKAWVVGKGWRFRIAAVPPGHVGALTAHVGQGVYMVGDPGGHILQRLTQIPYVGP